MRFTSANRTIGGGSGSIGDGGSAHIGDGGSAIISKNSAPIETGIVEAFGEA